jgi:DNA-binding transcriptional ArsR family regulator
MMQVTVIGRLLASAGSMPVGAHRRFVYHQSMVVNADMAVSAIAAAIGEPARARMLYSLVDGRARTSTELAVVAGVSPSTASVHLHRLKAERLVRVVVQGRHRYYSLDGPGVAAALEALSVLAGRTRQAFVPTTTPRLRAARTCYDHIAGTLGVALHDRFRTLGWLTANGPDGSYDLMPQGASAFEALGMDVVAMRSLRRRFAFACLDWSERRPHVGGALGAALLAVALKKRWVLQDLDSRALSVTRIGRREMQTRFSVLDPEERPRCDGRLLVRGRSEEAFEQIDRERTWAHEELGGRAAPD